MKLLRLRTRDGLRTIPAQAEPTGDLGMLNHQLTRNAGRQAQITAGEALRAGLVYTPGGVLDMTRRPVNKPPAVEEIVQWIGYRKGW